MGPGGPGWGGPGGGPGWGGPGHRVWRNLLSNLSMALALHQLCAKWDVSTCTHSALSCSKSFIGKPNSPHLRVNTCKIRKKKQLWQSAECRASIGGTSSIAASIYAKEMERTAAKESLFLAIKDAGGLGVLPAGKATDIERIDINERVIALERLNPTPRPTTSPCLEGCWRVQWFAVDGLGLLAAKFFLETFPSALVSMKEMDLLIMDGYAKVTAGLKFLSLIESNFILTTKLTIEGPLRLKEEYVEGVIKMPNFPAISIPNQFKDTYGQVLDAIEQLPAPVKETLSDGVKIPLSGTFQRMFIISYLDEEMLIVRDISGMPSILSRLDGNGVVSVQLATEYDS